MGFAELAHRTRRGVCLADVAPDLSASRAAGAIHRGRCPVARRHGGNVGSDAAVGATLARVRDALERHARRFDLCAPRASVLVLRMCALLLREAIACWRLHAVRRASAPAADSRSLRLLQRCQREAKVAGRVGLCFTPAPFAPAACGLFSTLHSAACGSARLASASPAFRHAPRTHSLSARRSLA